MNLEQRIREILDEEWCPCDNCMTSKVKAIMQAISEDNKKIEEEASRLWELLKEGD